jgi:heavy metal sensor kinase
LGAFGRPLRARTRLTLWYTVLLAGSLIALGSAGLWTVDRELWRNFDETLVSQAAVLESDLQHDVGHFGPEDVQEAAALGANLDVVREWDRNGKLVYRNRGASLVPASVDALPANLADGGSGGFSLVQLTDGRTVRLFSRVVADRNRTYGYVEIGQSTASIDRIDQRLRALDVVGVLLTLLVAGASGWFLAGRALGPIDRITQAAERISAHDLSKRLHLQLPDDELGRLAGAFDAMIARLDQAFERQRRFTADASHELRTPLGAIRAQAEVALTRPRSPDYYEHVLGSIRDETGRLTRLAESLLLLARADANETFALRALDLEDLVAEVGASVAPRARAAQVYLSVQVDGCPPVSGDAPWLTQLLLNLLDNAIRHTAPGGRLELALGSAHGGALVQVRDTGEGIPAGHLAHVFERFYRADAARARATGGAGLGLAICLWIAQAHGGTLTLQSRVGVGTTASLWLPAATGCAASVDQTATSSVRPTPRAGGAPTSPLPG